MTGVDKNNLDCNTSKTAYHKPLIIELSTDAGTQGMGMTPIFGLPKMNIGTEQTSTFMSVS